MTTSPRPSFDETLRRIDAVLDEPDPTPRPLVTVMRQRDDQVGQLLREGDWTAPGLLGRAIGWFRR